MFLKKGKQGKKFQAINDDKKTKSERFKSNQRNNYYLTKKI